MALNVKRGTLNKPKNIILYGTSGVGKSTLCASAPNTIFADMESGTRYIDCDRVDIVTFDELVDFMRDACKSEYQTIVLDSLTALDKIIYDQNLAELNVKSIEQLHHGLGYVKLKKVWERFVFMLGALNQRGKNVILIGHAVVNKVVDPTIGEYERYEFYADKRAKEVLLPFVDACWFMRMQIRMTGEKSVVGSGNRELVTVDRASNLGKTRFQHIDEIIENPGKELFEKLFNTKEIA